MARTTGTSAIASGLTALIGAGIIVVGARFLWDAKAGAEGYGVPERPCEEGSAYLAAKGVRDIATGLMALVLLALGERRALGWVSLAAAAIPASDAAIVLKHRGSPAIAYGVHGATAAAVLANACLLLREDAQRS